MGKWRRNVGKKVRAKRKSQTVSGFFVDIILWGTERYSDRYDSGMSGLMASSVDWVSAK